jgi:RNA polymerase sigma-70 factor (ECF subfamily)
MEAMPLEPERPFSPAETVELVQRAQEGDEHALEQLIARVRPRIQRWARGRLPRGARSMLDTVDIVQDVLVSSVRHLDNFEQRGPGAFLAYLRRGLVNRLEDERRKLACRPVQTEMPADVVSTGPSPLDRVLGDEQRARYEAALGELDDVEQAAIIGRFEWGYSYADLAIVLGKPTDGAARAAVVRAVQRLLAVVRRTPAPAPPP